MSGINLGRSAGRWLCSKQEGGGDQRRRVTERTQEGDCSQGAEVSISIPNISYGRI